MLLLLMGLSYVHLLRNYVLVLKKAGVVLFCFFLSPFPPRAALKKFSYEHFVNMPVHSAMQLGYLQLTFYFGGNVASIALHS